MIAIVPLFKFPSNEETKSIWKEILIIAKAAMLTLNILGEQI
jgi:hypothetical protein